MSEYSSFDYEEEDDDVFEIESKTPDDEDEDVVQEEEEEIEVSTISVLLSYVCEECDYRWDAQETADEVESEEACCPMCGSMNVSEI